MKTKEVRGLAAELLVDIDGVIAGHPSDPAARHTSAASAVILATRLIGGIAVNIARIAYALEGIEINTREDQKENNNEGA